MAKNIVNTLLKIAESVPKVGCGKLAAAVVSKGRVVSFGVNSMKTHPIAKQFNKYPYLHAETEALIRASKVLDNREMSRSVLYVVRYKYSGSNKYPDMGMAKPCSGCMHCAAHFGIKKIVYSTDDLQMQEIVL